MKIGIPNEITATEKRVAAVPDTVSKMIKSGSSVWIEKGAGEGAFIPDATYEQAGAQIADSKDLYQNADVILRVNAPQIDSSTDEIDLLRQETTLIAPLFALRNPKLIEALQSRRMTAFSLDWLPRIARAQSMDILSSMSNLAGYKSVILAADFLSKLFPMMTTAAGTIIPAKIIVIGVGVAGLQAIATARRLGAVVLGFDTRPVTEEQVKSLGAEFVSLETTHEAEDKSGYATEQSAEFYRNEQAIISKYIKEADVIITTALIPGKRAPLLITEEMVKLMQPGSVIVDLSAREGGNCALTEAGKIIHQFNVTVIGLTHLPSLVPMNASQLYANNVYKFLTYVSSQIESQQFDLEDEIVKSTLVLLKGERVHAQLKSTQGQAYAK